MQEADSLVPARNDNNQICIAECMWQCSSAHIRKSSGTLQACAHCIIILYHSSAGTHDNETTVGWWKDSAQQAEKDYIKRYLNTSGKDISGDFMREAFKSVSRTAIVMLQVCIVDCCSVSHWTAINSIFKPCHATLSGLGMQ